jgi:hypothetical protein
MSAPKLEVFDCEQNSPEWVSCRCGIPTASEFGTLLMKGKDGKSESKTRRTYLLRVAGERITGQVAESYTNPHMERGHIMEAEARDLYAFTYHADLKAVGFMRRGRAGASPDRLVDDNGLLEVKTKLPHLQLECLLADRCPPEHYDQVQGQLMISGREWCDLISYWPRMPLFRVRVYRDEPHIKKLVAAVEQFNSDVDDVLFKLGVEPMLEAA